MDFLSDFIEHMRSHGCGPAHPSDVVADDKMHRYQLDDEKGGKKSGRYCLRIDTDFAVGWCLNFREGKTHKWTSKVKREWTKEERDAYRQRIESERKALAARVRKEQDEAAKKASSLWAKATAKGSSAYLSRKKIERHGARFRGSMLVVPIHVGGKLTSLQFISENGEKRFVKGSEIEGGYFSIAKKDDDLSRIVICEGFATGATIRQATGLPVVVAFNAGNLRPVALAMRKKYPEARFLIAADNDQWTTRPDKVTPWNPGIEKAKEAAAAIGGAFVVWPEIPADDEKRRTDFNDLGVSEGLEPVRVLIMESLAHPEEGDSHYVGGGEDLSGVSLAGNVQTSSSSDTIGGEGPPDMPEIPIEAYADDLPSLRKLPSTQDWRELLLCNAEGKLKASSLRNAILFLKFHEDFKGIFAFNEFHQNIMLVRCPPWMRDDEFKAERLSDVAVTNCAAELEKFHISSSTDKAAKAIQVVAMENRFHPAREYFNGLEWDRRPRLHRWLSYYMGCEHEDEDYLSFVGTKWLTAAVARCFEPGCKFDYVLVFEGEQGRGKSTALRELATFGRHETESYFTDQVKLTQLDDKDTIMKMQGCIIVELGELSGFSKQEDEAIKQWLSSQFDDARPPYGREMVRFYRQFVLSASTNKHTYLKDPSGNRRYWPTEAGRIDLKALREDREQLWAEAVHLYRSGALLYPTEEEERLADMERKKRMVHDSWTDDVLNHARELSAQLALRPVQGFKTGDVMSAMGIALRDRDDRTARRISGILQLAGYVNRAKWNPETQKTERFWTPREDER